MRTLYIIAIILLVIVHFLAGIFVFLPYLVIRWRYCPLTAAENYFRRKLGWEEIKFIKHYIVDPYRRWVK